MSETGGLDDRIAALERQLARLNDMLETRAAKPVDITADDLASFQKVRDALAADFGEFCGINDCFRPRLCIRNCVITCRVCSRPCINECTCGPCNIDPGVIGGIGRFDQFG